MIKKQKQYIQQFSKTVTNPKFARIEKGMKTSSFTPSSTFVRKIDIFLWILVRWSTKFSVFCFRFSWNFADFPNSEQSIAK